MASQIITSELFVSLSDEQQELVAGGADFELSGSNYANRLANLQGITASGPAGSTGNSIGTTSAVNTAAQDLLGLGTPSVPTFGALGAAPVLTGLAATPTVAPIGGFGFPASGLGGIVPIGGII